MISVIGIELDHKSEPNIDTDFPNLNECLVAFSKRADWKLRVEIKGVDDEKFAAATVGKTLGHQLIRQLDKRKNKGNGCAVVTASAGGCQISVSVNLNDGVHFRCTENSSLHNAPQIPGFAQTFLEHFCSGADLSIRITTDTMGDAENFLPTLFTACGNAINEAYSPGITKRLDVPPSGGKCCIL